MPVQPEVYEAPVKPGANQDVWFRYPLLGVKPNSNYIGRVVAEVWTDTARLIADSQSLVELSVTALDRSTVVRVFDDPLSSEPATGHIQGKQFLGRLILEFWSDQTRLLVTGPEEAVLEGARKILSAG